jgi:hypothetical protein
MKRIWHIETINNGSAEYLMSVTPMGDCEWSFNREDAFEYSDLDEAIFDYELICRNLTAVSLSLECSMRLR